MARLTTARSAPWSDNPRWWLLVAAATFVLAISGLMTAAAVISEGRIVWLAWDSRAYWDALRSTTPYAGASVGTVGSFLYPPIFLQALAPLGSLPWPIFLFGWTAALAATAIGLLSRVPRRARTWLPFLLLVAGADVWAGNVNVFIAGAIVVGMTHPAAWGAVALTKVTPGIGLLWHGLRGDWTSVWRVVAVCALLVGASVAIDPGLWSSWLTMLRGEAGPMVYPEALPIPLYLRLPAAVAVVMWAARADRPELVPVASLLALPVIWFNGLALLLASAVLLRRD
jgi:hypothetical protein